MSSYRIERIDRSLYKYIKKLYETAFGLFLPIEFIEKKYDTSFFGKADIGYVAFSVSGEPAAYYGTFPITVIYQGKTYTAAQSGDTMTSPNHRGKGLFINLAKRTYVLAKNEGISFVFGFPNENSLPGFKNKLNWEFYGNMQDFTINASSIPLGEIAYKIKWLLPLYKSFYRWRLSGLILNNSVENIASFNQSANFFGVKKDTDFFNYKMYHDSYLIKLNGFTLFLKTEGHLYIGDAGYFEQEKSTFFINTVKLIACKLGCKKVILSVNKNHWLYDRLVAHVKPVDGVPIGFLKFDEKFQFDKMSLSRADYDTF